ncbi:MAG: nitrilase family protein [Candidatus Amulumruptor caecigallinarius]|nr:nitrilase family protein [Candidatus Amulumruptor caecigallinarius]MCM1396222.1 nitrilase family protein [Candidatus Amulumruptor caecigallinarius]MCM1453778.1 nitrilase family protein [bacterium]
MKVAALPLDIKLGQKHENLIAAAERLRFVEPDTDVVVLPETFTTGFIGSRERMAELAETVDGHTMDDVHRWASFFKMAIAGSFVARDKSGTHLYNRAFFIEPSGDETFYDKHHLFINGEDSVFTPGEMTPPRIRYMGWDFALGVCYDIRFPGWLRNRDPHYDVLLLPANWPEKRRYAWDTLLRARAIENIAYVVGANRSGEANLMEVIGKPAAPPVMEEYQADSSVILDFAGHSIGTMSPHGIIHATLDRDALSKMRRHLPALDAIDSI